jgi:hypothetical protein
MTTTRPMMARMVQTIPMLLPPSTSRFLNDLLKVAVERGNGGDRTEGE